MKLVVLSCAERELQGPWTFITNNALGLDMSLLPKSSGVLSGFRKILLHGRSLPPAPDAI